MTKVLVTVLTFIALFGSVPSVLAQTGTSPAQQQNTTNTQPEPGTAPTQAQSDASAGSAQPDATTAQAQPPTATPQAQPEAAGAAQGQPAAAPPQGQPATASPPQAQPPAAAAQEQPEASSGWNFFGDFRLRYEDTTKQEPGTVPGRLEARHRGVVRLRAGLTRQISNTVKVSARLATGASGDPNTTDVTLGDFLDDLEVSLDQVYLELKYHDIFLTGGMFANPFVRTPLVWDDDVNPQGIAASYTFVSSSRITSRFTGIYAIVDEQTVNPDSYMAGGQLQFNLNPSPLVSLTLAGAYYDYTITNLVHADSGDIGSNHLNATGTEYLSDYNLLDAVAVVDYRGLGARYPVRFIGDYVKNLGARVAGDRGLSLDVYVGRAQAAKDRRFRYGYSEVGADGVLAAFSHDDTTFATDYQQHSVAADYVVGQNTLLNATWYLFRRFDPEERNDGHISRLRLNVTFSF